MSRSGAASHTLPKCKFFNQLQFLQEKVTNKETVSNFSSTSATSNVCETSFSVPGSPASSVASIEENRSNPFTSQQQLEPPNTPVGQERFGPKPSSSGKKRGVKRPSSTGDDDIFSVIQDMNKTTKSFLTESRSTEVDNENMLFCKSLAPILDRLPKRDAALAKMKIQNVLFEVEFKE